MDTRELEWFLRLAHVENVTQVATEVHVTHSTLSRAIMRVEANFGAELFDREGKRLKLNKCGQAVVDHIGRMLDELHIARNNLAEMCDSGPRGTIHLSYTPWPGFWLVPQLLHKYRSEAPTVRFILQRGKPEMLIRDLLSGRTELLLTSEIAAVSDITYQNLFFVETPLYLCVSMEHPFANYTSISIAELCEEDFILPSSESELRNIVESLCRTAGFVPRVTYEVPRRQYEVIRECVVECLGVSVQSEGDVLSDARLGHIPIENAVRRRQIALAHRTGAHFSKVAVEFMNFVTSAAPHLAEVWGNALQQESAMTSTVPTTLLPSGDSGIDSPMATALPIRDSRLAQRVEAGTASLIVPE